MQGEQLDAEAMAEVLGEWLSGGTEVSAEDRARAAEALVALGIPGLVEEIALARRILRFGNDFHSVARFFADDSPEQRYLLALLQQSDRPAGDGS